MAQQLPSVSSQPPGSAPLILSLALPSIPGKVVQRIARDNPDLKEMLSDNIALAKRLRESLPSFPSFHTTSRFREVADPITWVYCFLNFIAVKVDDHQARSLIAYAQTILKTARRVGVAGLRRALQGPTICRWSRRWHLQSSEMPVVATAPRFARGACHLTTPPQNVQWHRWTSKSPPT